MCLIDRGDNHIGELVPSGREVDETRDDIGTSVLVRVSSPSYLQTIYLLEGLGVKGVDRVHLRQLFSTELFM